MDASSHATPHLTLQRMEVIDLPDVTRLESQSVPAHDVVPRDVIDYFVTFASNLNYIALSSPSPPSSPSPSPSPDASLSVSLLGYVVAAAAPCGTTALSLDMLNNHAPGDVLVIRSVVVAPHARRRGVGSHLLRLYLAKIRQTTGMRRVMLLAPPGAARFFERNGFAHAGPGAGASGSESGSRRRLMTKEL